MSGAATDRDILATVVLPWTEQQRVDEAAFDRQLDALLAAGLTDLYLFGTAGEGHAVTDEQFRALTERFANRLSDAGHDAMVGVISLSAQVTVERIAAARRAGVRRFQVSLPSWHTLDEKETQAFFEEVLGSFRDCEFLHYNVARSGRLLAAPEYRRLARRHANLVATKQSTDAMSHIGELLEDAAGLRHYFTEQGYAHARLLGDCGLLASVSLSNHDAARHYVAAGTTGDAAELLARQRELRRMAEALKVAAGAGTLIDGAYDKVLWKLHDPAFPLRMLPPHTAAREDAADRYAEWLAEHAPRWGPPERMARQVRG